MRLYRLLWILCLSLLVLQPAEATILSFSVTASPNTVTLVRTSPVNVLWTITGTPTPLGTGPSCVVGATYSITSSQAQYTSDDGSIILGTRTATVSGSTRISACPNQTVRIREFVPVPAAIVRRAVDLGLSRIQYRRTFNDGSTTSTWSVALDIAGSEGGGALGITRIALRFDDGAATRVVERGAKLGAVAEVNFSGSGELRAVWEIARPPSTQGVASYTPLRLVTRFLASGGRAYLPAPALPTQMAGQYLLRLRVLAPDQGIGTPMLRYVVVEKPLESKPPPAVLKLHEPQAEAKLSADTWFAWQAVPGARAYQLEIYGAAPAATHPPQTPVSGILVRDVQTRTQLSKLARAHLVSGKRYHWRVIAIGDKGQILAQSATRVLVIP